MLLLELVSCAFVVILKKIILHVNITTLWSHAYCWHKWELTQHARIALDIYLKFFLFSCFLLSVRNLWITLLLHFIGFVLWEFCGCIMYVLSVTIFSPFSLFHIIPYHPQVHFHIVKSLLLFYDTHWLWLYHLYDQGFKIIPTSLVGSLVGTPMPKICWVGGSPFRMGTSYWGNQCLPL